MGIKNKIIGPHGSIERGIKTGLGLSTIGLGGTLTVNSAIKSFPKKVKRPSSGYQAHLLSNLRDGNLSYRNLSSIDRTSINNYYKTKKFTKTAGLSSVFKNRVVNKKIGAGGILNGLFGVSTAVTIPGTARNNVNRYQLKTIGRP